MTIKLVPKLPDDTRTNGLSGLHLSEDESQEVVVVMRLASASVSHLFATDEDVFALGIVEVEAIVEDADAKEALELAAKARADRTGEYPLGEGQR